MEEMKKLKDKCEQGRDNFCSLVLGTADSYIKSDRWSDAIQLINYTAAIQGQLSEPIITQLFKKISKDATAILDVTKALKILNEAKEVIEKNNYAGASDKCSVYNNLACAYRRTGNLVQAKRYIEKALTIAHTHKIFDIDKACSFLNCCTILSSMGQHLKAAENAYKSLVLAEGLDIKNIENRTVLGMSYFNYALEKEELRDFKEARKFYRKSIDTLKDISNMQNMVNECKKHCENLKIDTKVKPKTRPISASVRSKIITYRAADRELLKNNNFLRRDISPKSPNNKSMSNVNSVNESKLSGFDMIINKKKDLDKLLNRIPVGGKKYKTVIKTKINQSDIREFRISSQSSIRILPTRPLSGINQQYTPSNISSLTLEVESQPGISLPSNVSPIRKIKFDESVQVLQEINEDILKEDAAIKIQAACRGKIIRNKLLVKPINKVLYRASKKIKENYYLVIVVEKTLKKKIIMKLLDLQAL